jgi:hypothetical protein
MVSTPDEIMPRRLGEKSALRAMTCLAGIVSAVLLAPSPAPAMQMTSAVAQLYSSVSVYPPQTSQMTVCYGFVCRRRFVMDFSPRDKAALAAILASGRASAAAERAAVQKAVIWFDRRLGPVIGTSKRVAHADIRAGADAVNFDCWDTTRNVTSLLMILQDWGLLKHHTVGDPHYRGNALVLQTPHNTAVLVDRTSKVEWVVDMWTVGYGKPPEVMTVADWMPRD